jgi:precorrin-6Y C5,15-methyltransferase (decarboxylating)
MSPVTVIGCLGDVLPPEAGTPIATATLVAGAARYLSQLDTRAECLLLGDVPAAVARLAAHPGPAIVLASGDPGFFGIVAALRRAGVRPVVVPAVSSVAGAFARVGLAWDDAVVVSAHGRALAPAVNACRAHRKVAVLTGPGSGPAELGAALAGAAPEPVCGVGEHPPISSAGAAPEPVCGVGEHPPDRPTGLRRVLVVAERLGTAAERVTRVTPEAAAGQPWPSPNVVLVLAPDVLEGDAPEGGRAFAGAPRTPGGWALPDDAFSHRMITKPEVRALVLARLGPRLGELVWDVGAGSGSVAVECARFGAAVIAVERDRAACDTIRANAARHGVDLQVVPAAAPACLTALPDPDAVFVGGGGLAALAAVAARRPARIVAAFAALERAGPAVAALRAAGYDTEGVQLQANRLTPLPDGTHRLAATNPVHVVSGVRAAVPVRTPA